MRRWDVTLGLAAVAVAAVLATSCDDDHNNPSGQTGDGALTSDAGAVIPDAGPVGDGGGTGGGAATLDQVRELFNTPDTNLALWRIQPGLGTVMIEYNVRFANAWFAAQANNWDMVHYQITEMREIQEVGETTRPARAPALKAFEQAYLDPLDTAAQAKDLAAFTTAYDNTIQGCNGCHAGQSSPTFPSFRFVKIMRPAASQFQNVDWAGQTGTTPPR
jgi:hypothetical protein